MCRSSFFKLSPHAHYTGTEIFIEEDITILAIQLNLSILAVKASEFLFQQFVKLDIDIINIT